MKDLEILLLLDDLQNLQLYYRSVRRNYRSMRPRQHSKIAENGRKETNTDHNIGAIFVAVLHHHIGAMFVVVFYHHIDDMFAVVLLWLLSYVCVVVC